ncbi:RNA-directed DNA polymerase, eukaryota, reverse transcriptase zinc-binding domain protein [Tanacetum coccineum]
MINEDTEKEEVKVEECLDDESFKTECNNSRNMEGNRSNVSNKKNTEQNEDEYVTNNSQRTYARMVTKDMKIVNNKLGFVPTMRNEEGSEIMIFDEALEMSIWEERMDFARVLVEFDVMKGFKEKTKTQYRDRNNKKKGSKHVNVEERSEEELVKDAKREEELNRQMVEDKRRRLNFVNGMEVNEGKDNKHKNKSNEGNKNVQSAEEVVKTNNKFDALNDLEEDSGELDELKGRMIVDVFLNKKIQPDLIEVESWTQDMIKYFKNQWEIDRQQEKEEMNGEINDVLELELLLEDGIRRTKSIINGGPWILLGDFNVTLKVEEHSVGGSRVNGDMQDLVDCVNDIEVEDVNWSGLLFTWIKSPFKHETNIMKKFNRVMANAEFIDTYGGGHARFHPFLISDHSPVVLHIPNSLEGKRKSFRFSKFIADKKEFTDVVKEDWKCHCDGYNMYNKNKDNDQIDSLDCLFSNKLSKSEVDYMVKDISDVEIKEDIFETRNEKAPVSLLLAVMSFTNASAKSSLKGYKGVSESLAAFAMLNVASHCPSLCSCQEANMYLISIASYGKVWEQFAFIFLVRLHWISSCGSCVKWVNVVKLRGKSIWEIDIDDNFDKWCDEGPFCEIIPFRNKYEARLSEESSVADMIVNRDWGWPNESKNQFSCRIGIKVPSLNERIDDCTVWKDSIGTIGGFSIRKVWEKFKDVRNDEKHEYLTRNTGNRGKMHSRTDSQDMLRVIMEYLVKIRKKARILELKRRNMKKLTLTSYTPALHKKPRRNKVQYALS